MGTDTTPPDPDNPRQDDAPTPLRRPEKARRAVASRDTNGVPRPQQAPDPASEPIVLPTLVPR